MTRAVRTYAAISTLLCACIFLCAAEYAHAEAPVFSADLHFGETSTEVEALQAFLNTHGFPLAPNGLDWTGSPRAGSAGNENDYFGSLTRAALMRFQSSYQLPATGYFGPLTRTVIENLLEGTAATEAPASSTPLAPGPQMPSWLAFFNSHAPPPGWIPGFGGGSASVSQPPSAPPDTTPPIVSLIAPSTGQTLAGIIALTASSSDNVGVASVQFAIDGTATGTPLISAPYTYNWNSANVSDGSHAIVAVARDAAGNAATSSSVSITTENAPLSFGLIFSAATEDDTGETITWSTNESSNSTVVYGTTHGGPYPSSVSSATLSTGHSITLPNLAGGQYYFEAVSTNAAGVTATSSEQNFVMIVLG